MDAQSPSSSRMGSVSFVFFLLLPYPSLLLLLTFLAPLTPRSHFLFARQINPPPRRNPPSLTGTSRCPRVPSFSSFPSRLIPAHSLALRLPIEAPFDRFLETKTSIKISKEVSFTVVTALVDTASIVLICCFQSPSRDRLG